MNQIRLVKFPIPKVFMGTLSFVSASALILTACTLSFAADRPTSHSLENYLKRLGYEPIPLKIDRNNKWILYGEINGKRRSFGVDTGCSMTVVDNIAGRKLQSLGKLGVQLQDSFFGTITNAEFRLMDVRLGSALFTNQPAWCRSLDASGQYVGDCILGCDFFFRNYCLIDCLGQKLYVRATEPPGKAGKALEQSLEQSGFTPVEIHVSSTLGLTVRGAANDEPIKLLLDTGASWVIFDAERVKRLHTQPQGTGTRLSGIGSIGSTRLNRCRLATLQFGSVSLTNVDVGIADLSAWKISQRDQQLKTFDGLLGADLLARNRALIDCHSLRLWLQP